MAIKERNGDLYLYFRPIRKGKQVGVKLTVKGKPEARQIEATLTRACRTAHYGGLDPVARETCVRMFCNQQWELPPELGGSVGASTPQEPLTLWRANQLFSEYPEIKSYAGKWRYGYCLTQIIAKFGKDRLIESIWIPDLKEYQIERQREGAAADTINRELSTLSRLFNVLIEQRLVKDNPVRAVKRLSNKEGIRKAYLSFPDVRKIADKCPGWFRPLIFTAYYTGMRRGEILSLTHGQVNMPGRIITLSPGDTKEGHWKRVPIHNELVPVLEEACNMECPETDKVFNFFNGNGVRPLGLETVKNPWSRACESLGFKEPLPHFHDLRHTWKANARRSGMDEEIRESILGHSGRGESVRQRYSIISEQELLQAIDKMTFSYGETAIHAMQRPKKKSKNVNKNVNKEGPKENRDARLCSNIPISFASCGRRERF